MTPTLLRATLTAAALLWGTTALAQGLNDRIERAFEAAGYDDIEITRSGGQIFVTAERGETAYRFTVDRATGKSTLLGEVARDEDEEENDSQDDEDQDEDQDDDGRDDDDDRDEDRDDDRDEDRDDDRDEDRDDDRDDDRDSGGDRGGDDRGGDDQGDDGDDD